MKGEFLTLIGTPKFAGLAFTLFFAVYLIVIYRAAKHSKEQLKKYGELPLNDK